MSYRVPPAQPQPADQPYSPAGLPFEGAGAPRPPSKVKRIAGVAVPVVGALVVGASWLGIGSGSPDVGDCIQTQGDSEYAVVDCSGSDAEYKVVGVEGDTYTKAEFDADQTLCSSFATAEMVLWSGELGAEGDVLCAEPA